MANLCRSMSRAQTIPSHRLTIPGQVKSMKIRLISTTKTKKLSLMGTHSISRSPTARTSGGKIYVDGVDIQIIAERVEYLDEDGKLITESLRDFGRKALRKHYASLDEFLKRWKGAERKQAVIDELKNEALILEPLAEEVGKDLDPFDLICHVAFDRPPLTRRERADNVRKRDVFAKYGEQARAVLNALLEKYQDEGVVNLDDPQIFRISPFHRDGKRCSACE